MGNPTTVVASRLDLLDKSEKARSSYFLNSPAGKKKALAGRGIAGCILKILGSHVVYPHILNFCKCDAYKLVGVSL